MFLKNLSFGSDVSNYQNLLGKLKSIHGVQFFFFLDSKLSTKQRNSHTEEDIAAAKRKIKEDDD